jgi:signal transduction histidine kinase
MASDDKSDRPERIETDDSLRTERAGTDRALAERQAAIEREADLVVSKARQNADAVLSTARDRADQQEGEEAPKAAGQGQPVALARVREDEILREERAAEDESVQRERQASGLALSRLSPFERDKTDRDLLTERARSDDALSNRDDFLGIVSHDLRDLLGGIVLSADVLADKYAEGAPGEHARQGASRIRRYAARMNRLIGDLIDVASIDAGKLAVSPVLADASSLVSETADTFQEAAAARQLTLRTELGERPLMAPFDHDRMFQVMANLVTNSIKFTAKGGSISMRAERDGFQLRLSVADTGPGIPADMLERVFQRFWQVGKDDRRGLGLGLYISRCIVEAHGGKIWAESKLGEGSRFTFTIPTKLSSRAQ